MSVRKIAEIDSEIKRLQEQIETLLRQRKIYEFQLDPDGYEARLKEKFSGSVKAKEGIYKKPAGSHRAIPSMILEVFQDFPEQEFHAGTMLSKLIDRGFVTRNRSPSSAISMALGYLARTNQITRISRGHYKAA